MKVSCSNLSPLGRFSFGSKFLEACWFSKQHFFSKLKTSENQSSKSSEKECKFDCFGESFRIIEFKKHFENLESFKIPFLDDFESLMLVRSQVLKSQVLLCDPVLPDR